MSAGRPLKQDARTRARAARKERGKQLAKDTEELTALMPDQASTERRAKRRVPEGGARNANDGRPRIRFTLGKRWSEIVHGVRTGQYTWEEFCEGLDPEELARAQLMDHRGMFKGRPPAMVPREFHVQCQRELRRRFNEKMQTRLLAATDEYIEMSRHVDDPKLREQMLRYVMERTVGPIPKTVEISTTPKHEGFLAAVIRSDGVVDRSNRYDRRTVEIEGEDEA